MRLPMPPLIATLAVAATLLTRGLLPGLPQPVGAFAGLALGLAGLALIGVAAARFAGQGTTVNPARPEASSALVTSGVNARTRNPMYIGEVMIVAAVGVAVNPLVGLPAAAVFWLFLDRVQIPAEERALAARFGKAYDAYRARVRRWL
jgi:protein-S-isoprenylcysteine O-methyltransferase Ste14